LKEFQMAGSKSRGIGSGAAVRRIARPTPSAVEATGVTAPEVADTATQAGGSIVSALQREGGRAATEVLMLAPSDVAEHPDNPRESLGDLSGLVASVRELGVLQPILVVPRREYLAAYPDYVEHVGERSWVTVAGHRRRAAALEAQLATIPALTRADLADPHSAIRTFLAENVHRQQLAPLEEARAFAMLTELGLGQRAIATQNGVSQGHVSKRLRLLQLSQDLQDALRSADLSIGDALVLADAPAEDREAAYRLAQQRDWPMTTAVGHIAQQREAAARRDEAADGDASIPAPESGPAPNNGVRGAKAAPPTASAPTPVPERAGEATDVNSAAAVDSRGSGALAPVSPAAVQHRADACLRLVRTQPAAARMLEDVAAAVLQGMNLTADVAALTHRWVGDQIGAPQEDTEGWWGSVVERDQPRLVWTLAIASLHLHATEPDRAWTSGDAHLANQLTRTGWHPSPVELIRLQRAGTWPPAAATTASPEPVMDLQEGPDA